MNPSTATRVAWSLWTLVMTMVAVSLVMGATEGVRYEFWLESTVIDVTFATLGALILSRQPDNRMGWLFLFPGVTGGLQFLSGQYAEADLSGEGVLPAAELAAALSPVFQIGAVLGLVYLIQLFPSGSPISARWRALVWLTLLAFAAGFLAPALRPGPLEGWPSVDNPVGVHGAAAPLELVSAAGAVMGLLCVLASLLSLGLRFRNARGPERLQIKGFLYASVMGIAAIVAVDSLVPNSIAGEAGSLAWTVGPLGLPIGAAIAILRYRLYGIDRLINKTIVYGAVTIVLAAVYFIGVLAIQSVLPVADDSPVVVAVTTLVVVALFRPLRARTQVLVDRRFNRRRYDAERTVEVFGARLREQTDIEALSGDLLGVVRATMQPAHVSLWLRGSESTRGRGRVWR